MDRRSGRNLRTLSARPTPPYGGQRGFTLALLLGWGRSMVGAPVPLYQEAQAAALHWRQGEARVALALRIPCSLALRRQTVGSGQARPAVPGHTRDWFPRRHRVARAPLHRGQRQADARLGLYPHDSPVSHRQIAQWCDRFWCRYRDLDAPPDIERVLPVLADVDAQWDLFVACTSGGGSPPQLHLDQVRMPVRWFEAWASQIQD